MSKTCFLILPALIIGGISSANGQYIAGVLSNRAKISILTVGTGDQPYTLFGHTAIRLHDPVNNIDRVYNFGTFDIDSPLFYFNFLFGRTEYYLSVSSFHHFKKSNKMLGRSITVQVLNLSPQQEAKLFIQLQKAVGAENSSYRYLFFRQNCVTKVHHLFIAQGIYQPEQQLAIRSIPTYRQLLGYYLDERPWLHFGINLLVGSYADRKPVARSYSFLPYRFQQLLQMSSLSAGKPLVQSSRIIVEGEPEHSPEIWNPEMVLWLLFIFVTGLSLTALQYNFRTTWIDRLLFGLIGLLGVIVFVLSVFSPRESLQSNWNLLWALPTHLWVALGSWSKQTSYYLWFTVILYAGVLIGWIFIPQQIPAAVIPLLLAVMVRSSFHLYAGIKELNEAKIHKYNTT